jgi:hypothetical protein
MPPVEMKTPFPRKPGHLLRSLGFLAALLFFTPSLYAGTVIFPGKVQNSVLAVYVGAALFLEAVCVAWLLRRFRLPRFFIPWVLGTHLVTFPVFLGVVWLLHTMFRYFTIALAEALVVWAEGWLVYQICRRPSSLSQLPLPSLWDCWFVTLIANACSLLAFWLLLVPITALFG